MYAFTPELQQAWQTLYKHFLNALNLGEALDANLRFACDEKNLHDPALFLGQTCGYPLVTKLSDSHLPVCVPEFNADGCDGSRYSSAIVVRNNSAAKNLADCIDLRVAINGTDSNSGMNVLRDAVSRLGGETPFFSETLISGGHVRSMEMVANGSADIAAIDCVTHTLARDAYPELSGSLKVIGYSRETAGLPFVIGKAKTDISAKKDPILTALNEALEKADATTRSRLRVTRFTPVDVDDYRLIQQMEEAAQASGHRADRI